MTHIVKSDIVPLSGITSNTPDEVLRIDYDGRIFWRQREVETDDDLRAAMRDLAESLKRIMK